MYQANMRYAPRAGDNLPRRIAKRLLRAGLGGPDIRKRVAALESTPIQVREQREYRAALATLVSPFTLRLAPDPEYLGWRYALDLPFAKYRLFEITAGEGLAGYVILHERTNRVVVAQADGSEAKSLAIGIMKAVAQVTENDSSPREILLTSTHPAMQAVFVECGMSVAGQGRPFVLKSRRGTSPIAQDTSNWLINFDWGDNSLRPPFGRG
jgi:hypothetical protein